MTQIQVDVSGLIRARWLIDQWLIDAGLAVPCDRCGGAICPGRVHDCPDVIDVQAEDPDLPALPPGSDL